jgi:hypothetical protein
MSSVMNVDQCSIISPHAIDGQYRVLIRIEAGGRIFIDDEETTDTSRIGARFAEWARQVCPKK